MEYASKRLRITVEDDSTIITAYWKLPIAYVCFVLAAISLLLLLVLTLTPISARVVHGANVVQLACALGSILATYCGLVYSLNRTYVSLMENCLVAWYGPFSLPFQPRNVIDSHEIDQLVMSDAKNFIRLRYRTTNGLTKPLCVTGPLDEKEKRALRDALSAYFTVAHHDGDGK